MSFIDKALERAKQQKPETVDQEAAGRSQPADKPLPVAGSVGISEPIKEICYTVTRTVPVSFDLLAQNRLIVAGQYPVVAEEYKHLRTHILLNTKGGEHNTLMFTGPRPDEGKTLTTVNLAISISQEVDQTVLLVDADLRNPSIRRVFGWENGPGLVDYLKNGIPIPDLLIHPDGLGRMVVLPGGQPATDAAELIRSPQMAELVQELKHCYSDRYVLFDLPPILTFADAMAFAPYMDGIVLVVEAHRTPREDIDRCLEMLKKFPLMGFVLNKTTHQEHSDYYYSYNQPTGKRFKLPWTQ